MKAYKRRINCAYRYGLKSNIKVIYIQPRIIVNIFESKYKSTLYIERTRINILVTDINVHMVTSKCHQTKKHPIYGAHYPSVFGILKMISPLHWTPFQEYSRPFLNMLIIALGTSTIVFTVFIFVPTPKFISWYSSQPSDQSWYPSKRNSPEMNTLLFVSWRKIISFVRQF